MDQIFQWTKDLRTNNEIINSQHKILFDLVNDLNLAFKTKVSPKVIDTMFTILINYTFDHFELEESLFCEEDNRLQHCYEHYQLIRSLYAYGHIFRNNRIPEIEPVIFLNNWLINHITAYDVPVLKDFTPDAFGILQLDSVDILPAQDAFELDQTDLRAFKRLSSDYITNKAIIGHCYNASKLKNSTVTIENLSSGGLSITDIHINHDIEDLVVISCTIGKNFRMKERLIVKNSRDNSFGLEFFSPSVKTKEFFSQLYGSVKRGAYRQYHAC